MKKALSTLTVLLCCISAALAADIKGSVKDTEGKGIEGVVVSDGLNVTLTDRNGRFQMEADMDSRWVFISTPAGYKSASLKGETLYYKEIKKKTRSYDFVVEKKAIDDTRHKVIVIADPQISDRSELPELAQKAADIEETVKDFQGEDIFGLCLGDIVGWDHSIYPEYNKIMGKAGFEYRNIIGNHDMTNYGRSHETSLKNYEDNFGPSWYSFNAGKVHYIVLNDNFFIGRDWYYIGYIDERQLQWMERDLAYVPKDHKVVVSLHIPTTLSEEDRKGFSYNTISEVVTNKNALYDLLKPYDALILSGHMHTATTQNIRPNLTEINVTGFSGAWWCGPVCIDGSPSGYKIIDVDGTDMEWIYKGCGHPLEYQMKLYVNHPSYPGEVVANVWDYDDLWKVEYFEDGKRICEMERFKAQDPEAAELYSKPNELKRTWVWAAPTNNMFKATVSQDVKEIEVRVTDRFGRVFSEKRTLN